MKTLFACAISLCSFLLSWRVQYSCLDLLVLPLPDGVPVLYRFRVLLGRCMMLTEGVTPGLYRFRVVL